MIPLLDKIPKIKIEVMICFLAVVHYVIEVTWNVSVRLKRANWLGTLDAAVPLIRAKFYF